MVKSVLTKRNFIDFKASVVPLIVNFMSGPAITSAILQTLEKDI